MTTQKIHYLTMKDTNTVIKAKLTNAFPGVKFSVRASRGSATNINWTDGPPAADVEDLIGGYCAGRGLDHSGDYTVTGTNVLTEPVEKTHKGPDGKTITETVPAGETVHWGPTYIFTYRAYSEKILTGARRKAAELLDTDYDKLTYRDSYHHLDRVEAFTGQRFHHSYAAGATVVDCIAERIATAVWRNEPTAAADAAEQAHSKEEELRVAYEEAAATPQAMLAAVPAAAELAAEYLRAEAQVAATATAARAERAAAQGVPTLRPLMPAEVARTANHSPNGGITAHHDRLEVLQIVVEDRQEGTVVLWECGATTPGAEAAVVVVIDTCMGHERIRMVPANHYAARRWTMASGAYAGSHRLQGVLRELGYEVHGLVPVHDRFEG